MTNRQRALHTRVLQAREHIAEVVNETLKRAPVGTDYRVSLPRRFMVTSQDVYQPIHQTEVIIVRKVPLGVEYREDAPRWRKGWHEPRPRMLQRCAW